MSDILKFNFFGMAEIVQETMRDDESVVSDGQNKAIKSAPGDGNIGEGGEVAGRENVVVATGDPIQRAAALASAQDAVRKYRIRPHEIVFDLGADAAPEPADADNGVDSYRRGATGGPAARRQRRSGRLPNGQKTAASHKEKAQDWHGPVRPAFPQCQPLIIDSMLTCATASLRRLSNRR